MIGLSSILVWLALAHDRAVSRDPSALPSEERTPEPESHRLAAVTPAGEAAPAAATETGGGSLVEKIVVRRNERGRGKKTKGPGAAGVGDLALLERDSTAELSDLAEEGRAQGLTMHLDDMDSAGEYHRTVPVVDGDGGRGGRGIGLFGAGGAWYLCENQM